MRFCVYKKGKLCAGDGDSPRSTPILSQSGLKTGKARVWSNDGLMEEMLERVIISIVWIISCRPVDVDRA